MASGTAHAGAALDDNTKSTPPPATTSTVDPNAAPTSLETVGDKVEYGADLRIRQVFLPSGLIGLFVNRAAGGASNTGLGVDLVRRRGNLELQLGFEFEHINLQEGVYINSGDNVPTDTADYILSPEKAASNFGWFTIEFTFMNQAPINKYLAFRYGGGAGLGILTGSVKRYDVQCTPGSTNSNPEPGCVPMGVTSPSGQVGQGVVSPDHPGDPEPNPYGLPPVFPVVNAIIGLQIKPTPKSVINIEGGIRTLPFIGISAGYFY
ncbi:MAG: hypothetical protein ACM31C_24995 [Acidobacteriota bacterium]